MGSFHRERVRHRPDMRSLSRPLSRPDCPGARIGSTLSSSPGTFQDESGSCDHVCLCVSQQSYQCRPYLESVSIDRYWSRRHCSVCLLMSVSFSHIPRKNITQFFRWLLLVQSSEPQQTSFAASKGTTFLPRLQTNTRGVTCALSVDVRADHGGYLPIPSPLTPARWASTELLLGGIIYRPSHS